MGIISGFFYYFLNQNEFVIRTDATYLSDIGKFIKEGANSQDENMRMQAGIYKIAYCKFMGEFCTDNIADRSKYYNQSLMATITNTVSYPFANPPASAYLWAKEGLKSAGFIPQAHAQGIGFYGLQPLAPIWKAFRNIAYMILVIGMVLVGFLIMFRYKIDPQTTISVESALPRFVYVLLTITFSFAIAGFLIDLMYILMGISVASVIQVSTTSGYNFSNSEEFQAIGQSLYTAGPARLFNILVVNDKHILRIGPALLEILPQMIQTILKVILAGGFAYFVTGIVSEKLKIADIAKGTPFVSGLIQVIIILFILFLGFTFGLSLIGLLISIIAWLSFVVLFFRILVKIFMTYTNILLWIIFSPLYLLQDIIPGKSAFTDWLKTVFAYLLTFPIIVLLLIIAAFLVQIDIDMPANSLWRPPFAVDRGIGGFATLIGMVLVANIPSIIDQVKEKMGIAKGPKIGVGALFGGAAGGVLGAANLYRGAYTWLEPGKTMAQSGMAQRGRKLFRKFFPKADKVVKEATGGEES